MPTTAEQIEQQIHLDLERFRNEVYKGTIEVPETIIEIFKKCVFVHAPQFHKVLANRIKVITSKRPSELTVDDLNAVITIVVNTPLDKIYENFDEAINGQIRLEKFWLSYNTYVEDFERKLKAKKISMLSIATGVRNTNGMRIIPHD